MDAESTGAAVVPITGAMSPATDTAQELEPWRMLADGSGMLVAWEPFSGEAKQWGPALAGTSGLARQLATVVGRAGAKLPPGETLFRLELPAGQTVQNLIPAMGGGLRAMTRMAGSSKFAGQAKLLPVAGAAGGTAVALGPLLGLIALSVAADMLASHQQNAKLEVITQVVKRLEQGEIEQLQAGLDAAEHVLQDAMWALLDRLEVPEAVALGPTVGRVKEIKARAKQWLTKWERIAEKFADQPKGADFADLKKALGDVALGGFDAFGVQVQLAYRALALDSRAQMVAMAEATMTRPEETIENFQRNVQYRLAENAAIFDRLLAVLWRLAETRLRMGLAMPTQVNEAAALQWRLLKLARAVSAAPSPPPVLTADHRLVIEAVRRTDGSITVLAPRAELAS